MKSLLLAVTCAMAFSATGSSGVSAATWVGTWGAPPTPSVSSSKVIENQTVRQIVRISAGGNRVRVRLSNEYGTKPLTVGAASISRATEAGASSSKPVALTFNGKTSVIIPPGAPMFSDPVALPVEPFEELSISLFFPEMTGPCTCHLTGIQTAYISGPGDSTSADFTPTATMSARAFLTGVEVEPEAPVPVLIAFGDSITDGYRSTENANHRWPDILAERLGGKTAVVSAAISGNRILRGGALAGESALSRFDRDALSVPGARWVIVLEGVNDLGLTQDPRPTADDMVGGYRQLVERAHDHGLKVYGATILPYGGAHYYSTEGESVRAQVNAWMRSNRSSFDGLIDFDAVMRDPANATRMRSDLQSGDWLHPNDAGYRVMAKAVDLKLFR